MDSSLISSLLLSAGIGLSLGIFGGGGSILAVPMLVLVAGLAPAEAVGTSLAMVGTTSLIASGVHHRRGYVVPKVALIFGVSGVLTAFLGAKLTALVSGAVIMHAFALLMLLVGVVMLFGKRRRAGAEYPTTLPASRLTAILAGAGVGLITGFLGVGGGFLVVPALIAFAGLDMRQAVGTSLLVIAINSAAGFAGHLGGGQLDFGLIGLLTTAAVAGALVGERLAREISTTKLRRAFGLLVIAVGLAVTLASSFNTNEVRSNAQGTQFLHGVAQPLAPKAPAAARRGVCNTNSASPYATPRIVLKLRGERMLFVARNNSPWSLPCILMKEPSIDWLESCSAACCSRSSSLDRTRGSGCSASSRS